MTSCAVRRDRAPRPSGYRRPVPSPRLTKLAVLAVSIPLLLVGCTSSKQQFTPEGSTSTPSATSGVGPGSDLDSLYSQKITWSDCGSFECAKVSAPLDWENPTAGTIELAVKRSPASGRPARRIGSLLIDPGGPGGSGRDFLDYAVSDVFGKKVRDAYDIVGFDPRGVGGSTAVTCGTDDVLDAYFTADVSIKSQEDLDAARATAKTFAQGCLKETGDLLKHVDTISAARDMDLLRAVLGDEKLNYAGFSYGTLLGATYADLYPEKVGHLLLDGALDPTLSNDRLSIQQAGGFEDALTAYVKDCQSGSDCPLTGSVDDGKRQIAELVARAKDRPLPAGGGHEVNGAMALYGIIVTLYDDDSWTYLTNALAEAMQKNQGSMLYQFANLYMDRTADGHFTANSMEAFQAINCLDYPSQERNYDQMVAFANEVKKVSPTFGEWFAMTPGCETWSVPSVRTPGEIHASGSGPILVVGTTGDPATPYAWAQALADQLDSGELLTWKGEGHTAYGRAGRCISDAVETYLLRGKLPPENTVCEG
jgi:pimeloyl-ACP methyl ester carboxylesterase